MTDESVTAGLYLGWLDFQSVPPRGWAFARGRAADPRRRGDPLVTAARTSQPQRKTVRSQRKNDRRQAIVETAARLFARRGYADCEMERVAAALRVAKGTLYLYFPGKQELFFACVDWGMAEMQRHIFEAAEEGLPPLKRISRAIRAYLEFFDQHPEYVELMIQERAIFRDRKKGTYFEHRDQIRPYFGQIYEQLQRDGILRSDLPVKRMLDAIGAMLYGTMFFNHAAGRSTTIDAQYRSLMTAIFGGLMTDAGKGALVSTLADHPAASD